MKHFIIGFGSIGQRHANNLTRNGHEVFAFDICPKTGFNTPVFTSIELGWEMDPDLVWVCTPTHLHSKYAIEALKRMHHVFIEKPVSNNLDSALEIKRTWDKMSTKRLIWIGCNMRFHTAVVELKNAINDGLIGKPLIYRSHFSHYLPNMRQGADYREIYAADYSQGGGIVLDDIHDIDLALWFNGSVKKVSGAAVNSGMLDINAEDIANISLHHFNGLFSEIHMDFLRRDKSRGIEVTGEHATIEWRSIGKTPEIAELTFFHPSKKSREQLWQMKDADNFNIMFEEQLRAILKAIDEPQSYDKYFFQALDALKVALEIRDHYDRTA